MKIDRPSGTLPNASLGTSPTSAQDNKVAEEVSAPRSSTTQVRISDQVQALSGHMTSKIGAFDSKKVDEIKTAITEGRFEVNAEKVADGVLQTVTDLIRSRPSSS